MIESLTIHRICLHEIYRVLDDGTSPPPQLSNQLLCLDAAGLKAFRSRIVAAFKKSAQCVEMSIEDQAPGSVFAQAEALISTSKAAFIKATQHLAKRLAQVQMSRTIPGGMVIVFNGTIGSPQVPVFAIMKAELHEGFIKEQKTQARFIDDLFLSPKMALHKIGLFISRPTGAGLTERPEWSVLVHDSQAISLPIKKTEDYFYHSFLGLKTSANTSQRVHDFFNYTREFIGQAEISLSQKHNLYKSLYVYLTAHQEAVLHVSSFSGTYMNDELADEYETYMCKRDFPMTAIPKDMSEIETLLEASKDESKRPHFPSENGKTLKGLASVEHKVGHDGVCITRLNIQGEVETQP